MADGSSTFPTVPPSQQRNVIGWEGGHNKPLFLAFNEDFVEWRDLKGLFDDLVVDRW